jgi:hypothetical protein
MATTIKNDKKTRRDRLRLFVNGMKLHLLPLKTITINQVVYQVSDLIAKVEADIASSDAAEKGHADWIQLVNQERASHASVDLVVSGTKQIVRVQFGNNEAAQSILADFGMTPIAVVQDRSWTPAIPGVASQIPDVRARGRDSEPPAPASFCVRTERRDSPSSASMESGRTP